MSGLKEKEMFKVKLNSLASKKSTYNQKNIRDMKTALHILSKILSSIWLVVSIPLKLILTVLLALSLYVLFYVAIVGAILWILIK